MTRPPTAAPDAGDAGGPDGVALVVVDLQNDFLHPRGAYAHGGVDASPLMGAVDVSARLMESAVANEVPIVATRFTLHDDRDGVPMISPHLSLLRPFLAAGDFRPGTWGHRSLDVLPPAVFTVDKVTYSAFVSTPLEWWLRRNSLNRIVVCGIVSNGGVASTARAAHALDMSVTVVSDGCAAFDQRVHEATMLSLGSMLTVEPCADVLKAWG